MAAEDFLRDHSPAVARWDRIALDATDIRKLADIASNAINRGFHIWTVIADEDDERALWPSRIGERIGLPVYPFKGEIACLPPKGTNVGCA